ncbi:CDP-glycerol glycerophosphotransferase family protein [Cupriavidus oxalaticus]|uniref:CDP-glycerol glycerophosphotransferase family protein n=1 Tax=Cupriavidus oxalaticus TaxID=96344 RepID=UPI003F741063
MNRKLAKLLRDPKLFFSDMWVKRVQKVRARSPKKMHGNFKYSVVSAVYNVEKYLDAFFESVVKQRLDFAGNIQLVMVDDGSQDRSAQIIAKWIKRYPKNIFYIRKENGGQASARNFGLSLATGDFVTFVDPDDFLDPSYFLSVDKAIKTLYTPTTAYVATRLVMYLEDGRTYRQHPLNAKFSNKTERISLESKSNIQLSSASAFFRLTDVRSSKDLHFPEDVKPSWEDAYFINNLAITLGKDNAILVPEAQYFYRRRADGTSTVDRTWDTGDKYSTVLQNGYLRMLEKAKATYGVVPKSIQHLVMYDVAWYIKRFVWNPREFARLPEDWKESLKTGMRSIFAYIDKATIESFHTAGFWYMYKKGIMDYYNKGEANNPSAYVRSIDSSRKFVELVVYDSTASSISVKINGVDRLPSFYKRRTLSFLGERFVDERIIWIAFEGAQEQISCSLAGRNLPIVFLQNSKIRVNSISDAIRFYKKSTGLSRVQRGPWMFMDRDVRADDNAEHFYRYVMINHPEREIYYALNRASQDWSRLEAEGFNLVDFSSDEFGKQLSRCEKFLSSHNYRRQVAGLRPDIMENIDFIFLQHGVTQNDVSTAFNSIKIDLFVAASEVEAQGILQNCNGFKLSHREVFASGFPRYDALVANMPSQRDYIVVMPTWREYLSGGYSGSGMARETNQEFFESDYLKHWGALLRSPELEVLALSNDLKVIFIPHPELVNYLEAFEIPGYIDIANDKLGIQDILKRAAIYVTDYSSVAFDVAYLNAPSIYFQFDEKEFFSRHYMRGYFDYRSHGFGPVVTQFSDLIAAAWSLLTNKELEVDYAKRRAEFFPVRDTKNCERLFAEIVRRDTPQHLNASTDERSLALFFANEATVAGQWELAEERWKEALRLKPKTLDIAEAKLNLARVLSRQGKFLEAERSLPSFSDDLGLNQRILRERASIYLLQGAWLKAEGDLTELHASHECDEWVIDGLVCCSASIGNEMTTRRWLMDSSAEGQARFGPDVTKAWIDYARRDWVAMCESTTSEELLEADPDWHLRRAIANRLTGKLSEAHSELVSFENYGVSTAWRVEVALLAAAGKNWKKSIRQLELAFPEGPSAMPSDALAAWFCCARHLGHNKSALDIAKRLPPDASGVPAMIEIAELATAASDSLAIEVWEKLVNHCDYAPYRLAQALLKRGGADRALAVLLNDGVREPSTIEEWSMLADLYYLNNDFALAIKCFNRCVQYFSGRPIPPWIIERLEVAALMLRTDSVGAESIDTLKRAA